MNFSRRFQLQRDTSALNFSPELQPRTLLRRGASWPALVAGSSWVGGGEASSLAAPKLCVGFRFGRFCFWGRNSPTESWVYRQEFSTRGGNTEVSGRPLRMRIVRIRMPCKRPLRMRMRGVRVYAFVRMGQARHGPRWACCWGRLGPPATGPPRPATARAGHAAGAGWGRLGPKSKNPRGLPPGGLRLGA